VDKYANDSRQSNAVWKETWNIVANRPSQCSFRLSQGFPTFPHVPRHGRQAPTPSYATRLSSAMVCVHVTDSRPTLHRRSTTTFKRPCIWCATRILRSPTFLSSISIARNALRTQEEDVAAAPVRQRYGFTAPHCATVDASRHGRRVESSLRLLLRPL
jgi:hypothetical protein